MDRRTKVAVAALFGIGIGGGLLGRSPTGTTLSAGAPDAAAGQGAGPAVKGPSRHVPAPEVQRVEITKPGDGRDYAVFRNGQVHKVRTQTRTFIVHHADGTEGTSIVEEGDIEKQLPPVDHRYDHVRPTAAQRAEMARMVGGPAAP